MREKREAREFDLENPIIKIEHLKKVFGTKEVLKDVNLIFPKGSTTVILGLSGSGKSTIIKPYSGAYEATDGISLWGGYQLLPTARKMSLELVERILGILVPDGAIVWSV